MREFVLLLGNPNAGKTTVFNAMTGLNAKVANYPGITVEARTGFFKRFNDEKVVLVDLPGTYSLFPCAEDEELTIKAFLGLIEEINEYRLIVLVIDSGQLRRGLYLYSQVIELGYKAIIALTMADENVAFQDDSLIKELKKILGTYVVAINSKDKTGLNTLKVTIDGILSGSLKWELNELPILYDNMPKDLEKILLIKKISPVDFIVNSPKSDAVIINRQIYLYGLMRRGRFKEQLGSIKDLPLSLERQQVLDDVISHWPEKRFNRVDNWIKLIDWKIVDKKKSKFNVDKLLLNPVMGTLFAGVLFFFLVESLFLLAKPLAEFLSDSFQALGALSLGFLPHGSLTKSLWQDGIVQGLGSILSFLPLIALLFMLLAVMEDSGYLARATFLFHKLLSSFGLCGRSLVPMLSGFACAVPAIMATRTIGSHKERLITILTLPFLTCSARLPVFGLIIGSTFSSYPKIFGFLDVGALLFLAMYLLGIFMTLISSFLLSKFFSPQRAEMAMTIELPPYRWPDAKSIFIRVWERVWLFLRDVGSIILASTILTWGLFNLGSHGLVGGQIENSFAGILGKTLSPIFAPLGFDWQITLGILASFLAREVFISTVAIAYGFGQEGFDLEQSLRAHLSPLSALSLLIFFTLSMQCISTLATTKRETRSLFWPTMQFIFMSCSAYFISLITYCVGQFLGYR